MSTEGFQLPKYEDYGPDPQPDATMYFGTEFERGAVLDTAFGNEQLADLIVAYRSTGKERRAETSSYGRPKPETLETMELLEKAIKRRVSNLQE